ncbi:MAG: hypothetical protein HY586_00115 [Candidatus Omnitrophica bacterium]|nr:hypothetical protein [Candidatus Omnitrophota bacterium]
MPTVQPRVYVTLEPKTYQVLEALSKSEKASMSCVVSKLVNVALELGEDLSLVEQGSERLASFHRDDTLSSQDLLKWNRSRKKK